MHTTVDGDARLSGLVTWDEKDAIWYQVFQGCSYSSMIVFGWSTEVIEEYATQYQDCLKSQDASHSAAFRSSILLHRPLSLDVAFPSIYNVTFPRIASSRSLRARLHRRKSLTLISERVQAMDLIVDEYKSSAGVKILAALYCLNQEYHHERNEYCTKLVWA